MRKCGFLTLLGLPNAGKSSLLNKLAGSPIAIVTPKAQTTRSILRAYVLLENLELVVVDTPGMQEGAKALNQALSRNAMSAAMQAVEGAGHGEIIGLVLDAALIGAQLRDHPNAVPASLQTVERAMQGAFAPEKFPLPIAALPILNKADLVRKAAHRQQIEKAAMAALGRIFSRPLEPFWITAHAAAGSNGELSSFLGRISAELPEGRPGELFEADDLTDRNVRDLAAEYIREQCFLQLGEELPYSIAVEMEAFDESDPQMLRARAIIHVEKESQKRIVIGASAQKIKAIGMKSRARIEALAGKKMFLGLKVKVTKDWSRKESLVNKFGYGKAEP